MNISFKSLSLIFLIVFFANCNGGLESGDGALSEFTREDFPISISVDCDDYDQSQCDLVESTVEFYNKEFDEQIFEIVEPNESAQIEVVYEHEIFINNLEYDGYTTRENGFVLIRLKNYSFNSLCVVKHEFGHALGLHGHIDDDEHNMMSTAPHCNPENYFEPFRQWFEENFI